MRKGAPVFCIHSPTDVLSSKESHAVANGGT